MPSLVQPERSVISDRLWSFRNQFDFVLRRCIRVPVRDSSLTVLPTDTRLAQEVVDFLERFEWPTPTEPHAFLTIADVGCRNFFLAPALDGFFRQRGWEPVLHGIEIDAYRRLSNLRTRRQYGEFYAAQVPQGQFHAMDFLKWKPGLDGILLLHPFVKPRSVLAWGLPLGLLRPEALFQHAPARLIPGGWLLVSSPTPEEMELSTRYALDAGLAAIQSAEWKPGEGAVQNRPRLGVLFRKI